MNLHPIAIYDLKAIKHKKNTFSSHLATAKSEIPIYTFVVDFYTFECDCGQFLYIWGGFIQLWMIFIVREDLWICESLCIWGSNKEKCVVAFNAWRGDVNIAKFCLWCQCLSNIIRNSRLKISFKLWINANTPRPDISDWFQPY